MGSDKGWSVGSGVCGQDLTPYEHQRGTFCSSSLLATSFPFGCDRRSILHRANEKAQPRRRASKLESRKASRCPCSASPLNPFGSDLAISCKSCSRYGAIVSSLGCNN